MLTIKFNGTRDELIAKLREVPSILVGKTPDPGGVVEGLLLVIGTTLLGKIQDSFITKSEGGTDQLGITWKPLSPVTLVLRRRGSGPKALARIAAAAKNLPAYRQRLIRKHYQDLLDLFRADARNSSQSKVARKHALRLLELTKATMTASRYKKLKKELSSDLPDKKAKEAAILGAQAPILRNTGRLLNSLSPQVNNGEADRILRISPGVLSVGSNVEYLKYHQSSAPRKLKKDGTPKLPRRQVLPDNKTPIPAEWWKAMAESFRNGVTKRPFWLGILGSKAS